MKTLYQAALEYLEGLPRKELEVFAVGRMLVITALIQKCRVDDVVKYMHVPEADVTKMKEIGNESEQVLQKHFDSIKRRN